MKKIVYTILFSALLISCSPVPPSTGNSSEPMKEEKAKDDLEILSMNETMDGAGMGMRTVHVELRNNTRKLCTVATLKSVYKNEAGTIVGTGNGGCMNLAAGATKVVDIMAMQIDNPKSYNVEVESSLFE